MSTQAITVGYDGSAASKHAVRWASVEAATRGSTLRIVSCYSVPVVASPWIPSIPIDLEAIEQSARDDVRAQVDELLGRYPDLAVETAVVLGQPGDTLVGLGPSSSMIVVGASGAGAARTAVLGSVAHDVARTAPCPVVLVPEVEIVEEISAIVVGVDGSPSSERAVEWAIDEADLHGAELRVVHAWEYPYSPIAGDDRQAREITEIDADLVLQQAVAAARERGASAVTGSTVEGGAAAALTAAAEDAQLLVVGSRGRGGFRSLLFGSVAHAVARHASCPVVVLRDEHHG